MIEIARLLGEIAQSIGPRVGRLSFRLVCHQATDAIEPEQLTWKIEQHDGGDLVLVGRNDEITMRWSFAAAHGGYWVRLAVESVEPLNCSTIDSLIVEYHGNGANLLDWWVPNFGATIHSVGLFRVRELSEQTRCDKVLRGLFADPQTPGLLLGTQIPQQHEHDYTLTPLAEGGVRFTATTRFPPGLQAAQTLCSETTWLCARKPIGAAIASYASHLAPRQLRTRPPVGWNSWDYYFTTVTLDDVIENMEAIRRDPVLAQRIQYIVVDHGWQHVEGEWFPNYRFPGGLERLVDEITRRGFIPGIWTAPILVDPLSTTALRQPELLLKNEQGDPVSSGRWYLLDPTHPSGENFVRTLYSRLFNAGFRFFKIDYVDALTADKRYHQPTWGPYDALRHLFATVRACVTEQSHILGCALPAECGAGYADSGRIGIDIHNQWSHVEWVADYLQLSYWLHDRIWINDPDFLIVRGPETSLEAITNVTNPNAHNPNPPRWRRGADFTLAEARTWASLVALAGGSVFVSDRLSQLNTAGRRLLGPVLQSTGVAAQPLDLCADRRATFWLQEMADGWRLTVINWHEQAREYTIDFAALGLPAPAYVMEMWREQRIAVHKQRCYVQVGAHDCALLVPANPT